MRIPSTAILALTMLAYPSFVGQVSSRPGPRVTVLAPGKTITDAEPAERAPVAQVADADADSARSGQPTRNGAPCRHWVKRGDPCWRHGG